MYSVHDCDSYINIKLPLQYRLFLKIPPELSSHSEYLRIVFLDHLMFMRIFPSYSSKIVI
jgi:hypothetical protein